MNQTQPLLTKQAVKDHTLDPLKQKGSSRPLITPEQCADFLQVKLNTLYVMKSQGRIPYRKVGHLLRFDLEEIIQWTKAK